MEFFPTAMAYN